MIQSMSKFPWSFFFLHWPSAQEKVQGKPPGSVNNKRHPLYKRVFAAAPPTPADDLTQSVAKQYFPPGTYVWRANTVGQWKFHIPAMRFRGQASWSQFGGNSRGALKSCMERAWARFLEEHRLPKEHCPIKGLLG